MIINGNVNFNDKVIVNRNRNIVFKGNRGTVIINERENNAHAEEPEEGADCEKKEDFDSDIIKSFVTDMHKDEIVKILTNMISPLIGRGRAKEALLPLFCAIYELGWMMRPGYSDFSKAFPSLQLSKAAYSNYLPKDKESSIYSHESGYNIEVLTEQMHAQLTQFLVNSGELK